MSLGPVVNLPPPNLGKEVTTLVSLTPAVNSRRRTCTYGILGGGGAGKIKSRRIFKELSVRSENVKNLALFGGTCTCGELTVSQKMRKKQYIVVEYVPMDYGVPEGSGTGNSGMEKSS